MQGGKRSPFKVRQKRYRIKLVLLNPRLDALVLWKAPAQKLESDAIAICYHLAGELGVGGEPSCLDVRIFFPYVQEARPGVKRGLNVAEVVRRVVEFALHNALDRRLAHVASPLNHHVYFMLNASSLQCLAQLCLIAPSPQ